MDGRGRRYRDRSLGELRGQSSRLCECQRLQVDRLVPTLPVELPEALAQWMLGAQAHVPMSPDEEMPRAVERAGHVLQEVESWRIRPLKVVQDDHKRTLR
jgi:hypothetical protein